MNFSEPISGAELALFQLQTAHSVQDVAHALGLDSAKFFYVVQNTDSGIYYKEFQIPKKSGGQRDISMPLRGLALAQDRLCPVLHHVYRPGPYVMAFVKGTSFVKNAQYHHNQSWVLNIDIKDFFPSITFARIRGLFMSNLFGFNERVATILARVCTFQGVLPQGASTSPILANIIAKSLDKKFVQLAKSEQVKYSRYSDDLTFSSSKRSVPKSILKELIENDDGRIVNLGDQLKDVIRSSGFRLNDKKTRIMFRDDRQEVTGLIVNQQANVWRKDISRLRKIIYTAKKHGLEDAGKYWLDGDADKLIKHLAGWLAYIRQVRGPSDPVLAKLCLGAYEIGLKQIDWIEELADMTKEFDIFLSHASEDKDQIRPLKEALESHGVRVFFDESSIKWGDSIVEKVNHGLLKSTFFMPFLTPTFSKKGWTNKELNTAFSMNANRKGRIIPIKSDAFDLDAKFPLLSETLYKSWPTDPNDVAAFINEVCDEVLEKIASEAFN